jgi:hypothetical protein
MTSLSTNSRSRAERAPFAPTAIVACGALGPSIHEVITRRGWTVDVHLIPALLHNRPTLIAPEVEALTKQLQRRGQQVGVAYADCGTYGALDDVCERLGVARLHGQHCYDVFAGADQIQNLFDEEPGTYLLTDFLVQSFRRTVISELGLDRYPELWGEYFANYRRVVWLAQRRSEHLEAEVRSVADMFGLPLVILDVGTLSLEVELEALLNATSVAAFSSTLEVQKDQRA